MRAAVASVLVVLALAGCGASQPTPPPQWNDTPRPERDGELKAATWRTAAAAEAARLQRAIRRARRSTTVPGALRLALLTGRLTLDEHARLARDYDAARGALHLLEGARAAELGAVLAVVERLAGEHRLTASRLRPALLVLRRNTEFWTRAPVPAPGYRTSSGPAVFQYYPGRGIQLQPLASWGRVNWTAGACLRDRATCPRRALRRSLHTLLALGSHRGGFLAWEHYFDWGGGTAPWISGMTQATAISALARGSRVLRERRWRRAARRALGAFRTAPPVGVAAADHFLMYSFAPTLRIFNGELQAVSGIGELAALKGERGARRLFRRGERAVRRTVAAFDTGAWSLYSQAGREATLDYHRLIGRFLGDMCARTERRTYCAAHRRFARYEHEPTRIGVAPLRRLVARRSTPVRFSLSKVSSVRVRVSGTRGTSLSRDLELPRGPHALAWTPPARGRFRLRIEARGPSGPVGVAQRSIRIRLPKPKPQKRKRAGNDDGPPKRAAEQRSGGPPERASQRSPRSAGR
jgi:D-glucuronyl C5-epimerase-like protein